MESIVNQRQNEAMQTLVLIQSRLDSTRLPGKALLPLGELPMFAQVYHRLHGIGDRCILAVPASQEKVYNDTCPEVVTYGGSREHVWDRFIEAMAIECIDYDCICRITADCPLICHDLVNGMIQEFQGLCEDGLEYVSNNTEISGYPDGLDVEVFTPDALFRYVPRSNKEAEHVTMRMKQEANQSTRLAGNCWPPIKLSVDTEEDYARVKKIYDAFNGKPPLNEPELLAWVKQYTMELQ